MREIEFAISYPWDETTAAPVPVKEKNTPYESVKKKKAKKKKSKERLKNSRR